MQTYIANKKGNILFLAEKSWLYLDADDLDYGTFSAFISGEKPSSLERLQTYFEMNPDKTPDYVYVPKTAKWDMKQINMLATSKGYIKSTETGYSIRYEKIKVNK